jgi:hypothetical protein
LSSNRAILSVENPTLPSYVWTSNSIYSFDLSSLNDDESLLRTTNNPDISLNGEVTWITCGNGSIDTGEICDD